MTPELPSHDFRVCWSRPHQSVARGYLPCCGLVTDRKQRAYGIVRKHHSLTVARVNRRDFALSEALRPVPKITVGGWA